MSRFVIIGAGKSGRGFIGRLLSPYGDITFLDRNEELIGKLSDKGYYDISYFTKDKIERIDNYKAFSMTDPRAESEIGCSEYIFISVGSKNVDDVLTYLSGIQDIGNKHIFICENGIFSAEELSCLNDICSLGLIFCSTVDDKDIDIRSEDFNSLYIDDTFVPDDLREVKGLRFQDNFGDLIKRKIYTYNAASAVIGFLGKDRDHEYLADAAADPYISERLDKFYCEVNKAMCLEYGVSASEQKEFAEASRRKFENSDIEDPVDRNIRNPANKLLYNERLIYPLILFRKYDLDYSPLAETIASAVRRAGVSDDTEEISMFLKDNCSLDDETIKILLPYFA